MCIYIPVYINMARSLWKGNKFDRNTTNFKELYKLD